MACHGRPLALKQNGRTVRVRAFLQPVNSNVESLSLHTMGPLGREGRERFLYIGPAGSALAVDDRVVAGGQGYLVRSAELVYAGEEALYCWAMCVKEGGESDWGANG